MKKHPLISFSKCMILLMFCNLAIAQESDSYLHLVPNKNLKENKDLSDFAVSYQGESSNVSIINFDGNYDLEINGSLNIEARQAVTQEFYSHQPDQYDFLVIFTQFIVDSGESAAFAVNYENDVQGIGQPLFDNSLTMGSERLQTTIDMTEITDWELNPRIIGFESTLGTLMHEMMHRWGIYVSFENSEGQISDLTLGRGDSHWNYFLNSNASLMYGSLWNDLGSGQFETQSIRKSLSPLDLYLMGFKEAASVPDFFLIDEGFPGNRIDLPSSVGTQVAGNRIDISIDNIIAAEGERVPVAADAQHKFNFKFILLKPSNMEVASEFIGGLVVLQREFQKRFFAETIGLGEIYFPKLNSDASGSSPSTLPFNEVNNQQVDFNTAELFLVNSFLDIEDHWRDKQATKYRDTAMAVSVLRALGEMSLDAQATNWIRQEVSNRLNNDDLAWMLLSDSFSFSQKNDVAHTLKQRINDDGGWGLSPDSESSLYDTVLVLKALKKALADNFAPNADTILYIQNQFNSDGGVGYSTGGKSSLMSSALLLSIIHDLPLDTELEQLLVDFIVSKQNSDGGFGVGQSTAHETAMVIMALSTAQDQSHSQVTQDAKLKLATMQSVDGSFEGSVYSTALALEILFNDQRPNLNIGFATLSNIQAVAGEHVSVEYKINNTGETSAEVVSLGILNGQQIIATDVFQLIPAGQSITGQLAFDTSAMLGTVELDFIVDSENTIIEPNESDNEVKLTLDVQAQSTIPELAIDRSSVVYNTDYFDALPFDFSASFNVSNLSTIDLVDVKVSLMRTLNDLTSTELQSFVVDISSNQNQLLEFNVQISEADDDLELIFVIDPDNQVDEVNEFNNEMRTRLRKLSTIDLSITESQISMPNQFILGQQTEISFAFSNLGTQLSPGFEVVAAYTGSDGAVDLYDNQIVEMLGGQQLTRQFSWIPSELGDYSLQFFLDEENNVAEVNENNNSVSIPITVIGNSSTNLQIFDEHIGINPDPGLTGQTLEIIALIRNNSNTDSGPFDVNFYQQQFEQPSQLISSSVGNISIPAGGESFVSAVINEYTLTGDVTFVVEVDPNNSISEFDENDNIGLNPLRILNQPDGFVSSGGFNLSPNVPVLGAPLSVVVITSNLGEQDLTNAVVKLYTKSNTNTNEVGSKTIPLIEAGQTQEVTFEFIFPNNPDVTTLLVTLDEINDIQEVNENNNSAELIIENQSKEFYVTESYFSPNGDAIKDQTQIVFNLDDVDNYKIKIINQFDEVVRIFPTIVNSSFGDVLWNGRDNNQKIVNDGEYLVLITGANIGVQKLTTLWLDTNRTTLNESLAEDDGYITELNCAINIIGGYAAEYAAAFSLDGQYIYLKSYFPINSSQEQKGLFKLAIDGSSIKSIIPPSFSQNNLVEQFTVLDNGHVLLKTKIFISGQQELWYLDTNNQSFYQLDTQGIFSFNIEITHVDYSIINFSGNTFDSLKVYHSVNQSSESFSSLYEFGSSLMKISGGWIERSNNQNIWYRSADLQTADIRLGDFVYGISSDLRRALIQRGDEAVLFAFNQTGVSEVKSFDFVDAGIYTNRISFASDNQFIWVNNGLIELYGTNGDIKLSVEHPYNLDYVKDWIVDEYGSLNGIPVDTEVGTFIISYDQLENPRFSFDDFKVSWLSETEFALQFYSRFSAEIDPNALGGMGGNFDLGASWLFKQRVQFEEYPAWEKFPSIFTSQKLPELSSPYYLNGNQLIRKGLGYDLLESENDLFDNFNLLKTYPARDNPTFIKSLLLKNKNPNYVTDCKDVGDNGIYGVYLPKDNLTAFLNLNPASVGVEIRGTIFDANLEKYEVYYADSINPGSWNLIGIGTEEKDQQLLFNWLAPASGAYRIKLVVFDKSGNTKEVIKSIQVARGNSTISVPTVEPLYFSPNGDGISDSTGIQYSTLQAGEVLISVSDENGNVVKTWVRDYAQAGELENIVWDGRDEDNNPLQDGEYLIKVGGFIYQVLIDNEPPGYGIGFTYPQIQSIIEYDYPDDRGFYTSGFHNPFSFRGNLWRIWRGEFSESYIGSPLYDPILQKYDGLDWLEYSDNTVVINPGTYFTNRELYRYKQGDYAGNVGGSSNLKLSTKIYPAELLKLKANQQPGSEPFIYPMWEYSIIDQLVIQNPVSPEIAPNIVDWGISDKLGFSIQTLTNESIASIKMTTTYENDDNQTISDDKLVETAGYDLVQDYYPGFQPVPQNYPLGSFFINDEDNEIVLHLVELDKYDFPEVFVTIKVDFEVTFINNPNPENISFNIQFDQEDLPIFIEIPLSGTDSFNNLAEEEKEAYLNVLDQIDVSNNKSYLWFYKNNLQLNSQSWVDLTLATNGDFVSTAAPLYTSASLDYLSQVFEFELLCKVTYQAEWKSVDVSYNEPILANLLESCDFNYFQEFKLNEYCDQNASLNETTDFQLFGNLENDSGSDPILLQVFARSQGNGFELVYSDNNISDDIFVTEGTRRYAKRVQLPVTSLLRGVHILYVEFTYASGDVFQLGVNLVNVTQAPHFEIIEPVDGQFYCGQNGNGGTSKNGVSEVPVNLVLSVPDWYSKPYAVNLVRFVDGVNLDLYDPLGLESREVYENINRVVFDYEEYNSVDPQGTFSFVAPQTQQDLLLKLGSRENVATLQLETINTTGVSQCKSVEIQFDSLVKADIVVSSENFYFSPNLSGLLNYVNLTAEEAVDVVVEVYDEQILIEEIASFSMQGGEVQELYWNGVAGVNVLADGRYRIEIRVTDTCGNWTIRELIVFIDNTPPQLNFIDPVDGGEVSSLIDVIFQVDELNLMQLELDYEYLEFWTPISFTALSNNVINPAIYIGQWDLNALPLGTYPLRLSATDKAGNESISTIQLNYVQNQDLIWQYSLTERFISPNADAVKDNTRIDLGLNMNANVSLTVIDSSSSLIKSLFNQTLSAGSHSFNWDGTDDLSQGVIDGTYQIKVEASEVGNLGNFVESYLTLKSDVTSPVAFFNPNQLVIKGEGDVTVAITDDNLNQQSVSIQQLEPIATIEVIENLGNAANDYSIALQSLNETNYQIKTAASDFAGNEGISSYEFIIDNTLPMIELLNPVDLSIVGGLESEVSLNGLISESNFAEYKLFISENTETPAWSELFQRTELIDNQFSHQWLINEPDGSYLLRALAIDQAGWEAEVVNKIIIDTQAPSIEMASPVDASLQGQSVTFFGSILDENLSFYHLSYRPQNEGDWTLIHSGIDSIDSSNILTWEHELPSGSYDFRLFAGDQAGLTSELIVTIEIDSSPPQPPVNLTANLNQQLDVNLIWLASPSEDVVGYLIYRNNTLLNNNLITVTEFQDSGVPEGEYSYWVEAVDETGNNSDSSNVVQLLIDRTGPLVSIQQPADSAIVNGVLDIIGTVEDASDFNTQRLYIRVSSDPAPGVLLAESYLPTLAELLAQVDTTVLSQDTEYIIRLEALDLSGNLNAIEHTVLVDNIAPAAPLNLTYQMTGSADVKLDWQANQDNDLAGYLVYRNGNIISGNGTSDSGIVTDVTYLDENVVDGVHQYHVTAVDLATNISELSNVVTVNINRRTPETLIMSPIDGLKFENPVSIFADSEDEDIAFIDFEYSIDNITWQLLDQIQNRPFATVLDPNELGFIYSQIHIRATAQDLGGQVDPTPAQISLDYTDLTAPTSVQALQVVSIGADVNLSWDANLEIDLQGYQVSRKQIEPIMEDDFTDLHVGLLSANGFSNVNVDNGLYRYRVIAVDDFENKSNATQSSDTPVWNIDIKQPYSPVLAPANVILEGFSLLQGGVLSTLEDTNGTQLLPIEQTLSNGQISISSPMLVPGENTFSVNVEDNSGNQSKVTNRSIEVSTTPIAPINTQSNVNGYDVILNWESPEPETTGYLPYIDQVPVYAVERIVDGITFSSSSYGYLGSRVIDGNDQTVWVPSSSDINNGQPTFIELIFDQPKWVVGTTIQWDVDYYFNGHVSAPSTYLLQYLSPVGWVTQKDFTGVDAADVTHSGAIPYLATAVRVWMPLEANSYDNIRLSEVNIQHQPLTNELSFSQTFADGEYEWQVSAINQYGFESERTLTETITVGDVSTPEAVVLNGQLQNGNSAQLDWGASSSMDVAYYRLFRNSELIVSTTDAQTLEYLDTNLANGEYSYAVVVVDEAGNSSEVSNVVSLNISQQVLDPPTGLSIESIETGKELLLSWDPHSDPSWAAFKIYRSLSMNSGFVEISLLTDNTWLDKDLNNGVAYYYYLTALDVLGNESQASLIVLGIPNDLILPVQPVITEPTVYGAPIAINALTADISGLTDTSVQVDLYQAENLIDTVVSSDNYTQSQSSQNQYLDNVRVNGSNTRLVYYDYNSGLVTITDPEAGTFTAINDFNIRTYFWNQAGTKVFAVSGYGDQTELKSFGLDGIEIATHLTGYDIKLASVSADESQLLYWGDGLNPLNSTVEYGLWLYTFAGASHQKVELNQSIELFYKAIQWMPNGQVAFINFPNGVFSEGALWIYDKQNNIAQKLVDSTSDLASLRSSLDGLYLYFDVTENGYQAVKRHRISDGDEILLSRNDVDISLLSVGDDADSVFVNADCCSKELIDIVTAEVEYRIEDAGYETMGVWLEDGTIFYLNNGQIITLKPPGLFQFFNAELIPGLNEFFVISRKSNGLISEPSQPIEVTLNNLILPDLVIESNYLQVIPSQVFVGEQVTGSLLVKNNSQIDVDTTNLLIELIDPDLISRTIHPSPYEFELAAGDSLVQNFDINGLNKTGEYTLRVAVDYNQQVLESNENNNSTFKVFQVIDDLEADISISLNDNTLSPGDDLSGQLRVYNPANDLTGFVRLRITDTAGFPVGYENSYTISELGNGAVWEQGFTWSTTEVFAGDYQVEATLYDVNQIMIAQAISGFTLNEFAVFDLDLTSSSSTQVAINDEVNLSATLNYQVGNVSQSGTLSWQVFNEGQQLVWSSTQATGVMSPGFNGIFEQTWTAGQVGTYQAKVTLETPLSAVSGIISFEVIPVAAQLKLSGLIEAFPAGVILGQSWNINFTVENNGQVDVINVPISLSLWDSELTQLINQENTSVSLTVGANSQLQTLWGSDNLTTGNYVLLLTADLSAQGESESYLLDNATIQTTDISGPQINLLSPLASDHYPPNLEIRAEVIDLHADVVSVDVSLDGNPIATLQNQQSNDLYSYWFTGLIDGPHQLTLEATDSYANGSAQSLNFTVDSTFPVIDVTGVSDGGLYNNSVQADINITDSNLSASQVVLDGVPYVSGTSIANEGSHILMVSATDMAGNKATSRLFFNIDLTPPTVIITYPSNDVETNQVNTLVSGITEAGAAVSLNNGAYVDDLTADLQGNFSFIDVPLTSGSNSISVSATDLSGNQGLGTDVSVILVDNINVNGLINTNATHPLGQDLVVDWQINNENNFPANQLPIEINLYRVADNQLLVSDTEAIDLEASGNLAGINVFETNSLNPGDYRIELRVEIDQLWQILDDHLLTLQDVLGPEIVVIEPVSDQLTQATADLLVQAIDVHSEVDEVSYQLDSDVNWIPLAWSGTEYVAQLELTHGEHSMVFRAQDTFANETLSQSIQFVVDTNAPVIDVISPTDGLITNQPVTVEFSLTDDHAFNVEAQLNGIIIANGHAVSTEGEYELVISATDEVNNQSEVTRNFIVDTTAPVLVVTSPATDIQVTTGSLDIIGQAEARNNITISVNGDERILKTDALGQFTSSDHNLQVGMNLVVVTATDQAGNTSEAESRTVEYIQVGSITGRIWQDDDQDAIIDVNEMGFNQVALRLTDSADQSLSVLTDVDGYYAFNDVVSGQYTLEVIETELLSEWINTTSNNPFLVDLSVNQDLTVDFGFYQEKPVIEASVSANNIKGRMLLLVDPPTAQIDSNQCLGVNHYQMQRFVTHEFTFGDSISASLFDAQGTLLQTEAASYSDFVNNGYQSIDLQIETNEFNLILHPINNRHLKASVFSSSFANPAVLLNQYRLALGLQTPTGSYEWSSELVSSACELFSTIGSQSGELQLADVGLNPPLPSDDPNGSDQAPHLSTQYVLLENMLRDTGWSYDMATESNQFESQFADGNYVAYWLMAENISLPSSLQNNIMDAVDEGAGLVVSSGHDNLSAQFYSSLGVNLSGNHMNATELALLDSPISALEVLDVAHNEQVLKVSLAGAQSAGEFTGVGILDPDNQALTWIDGIDGSSVFSGIDWLLQATESTGVNHYVELIKATLEYIHPLGLSNELGYARAVQLSLQNAGRPVNGFVQVLLPQSVTLAHAAIPVVQNQDGFTFEYNLLADELLTLEFWLTVNDSPATVTFEIHLNDNANVFESLDLNLVAGERPDLVANITNCQAGVDINQTLLYRYQITNTGNKTINAATVFTDFDTNLQNPTWTCSGTLGGVCNQVSGVGNLIGQSIDLPLGSSVSFMFDTQVVAQNPSSIMASAHVEMPADLSDVNPLNNSASDYDAIYQFIFKNSFDCAGAGQMNTVKQSVVSEKGGH